MKLLRRIWSVARNTGDINAYGFVRPETTDGPAAQQVPAAPLILEADPAEPGAFRAAPSGDSASSQEK